MPSDDPKPKIKKPSLPQTDVPSFSLEEATRVPRAIAEELAKQPSTPLQVAAAMGVAPTTGNFRTLTATSLAYGLTEGGAFAERISLTELGRRIVAPTVEGDDHRARLEAVMRPRVTAAFLTKYDGSKWPRPDIARNVLEEMGVHPEQSARAHDLIRSDAEHLGLLTSINGTDFVNLGATTPGQTPPTPDPPVEQHDDDEGGPLVPPIVVSDPQPQEISTPENRRVFITHGSNQKIVAQIKKLLSFGDFLPVVAVESQSTAKPVPDKVLDEMRGCAAAVVHVGSEIRVLDNKGEELSIINPNVLIEIGAAMALYGRKFILLVEHGVTLPSNLQGLYEVRYTGDGLDHESTMALLEAFGGFKGDLA